MKLVSHIKVNCLLILFAFVLFETLLITSSNYVEANEDETDNNDAIATTSSTDEASDEKPLKVLSSTADAGKGPVKIKRTIRVRESPPEEPQLNTGSGSPSSDVQAKNGALTNNVEVKPEISIQMPQSSKSNMLPDKELPQNIRSRNSRVNKIPYKPRYTPKSKQIVPFQPAVDSSEPKIEEIVESTPGNREDSIVPYEEKPQPEYKVEEPAGNGLDSKQIIERDNNNISGNEIINSGNEFSNSMLTSGNQKTTMLNDVGNSETVLIDGVGNNKVTKISNSGNTELNEQESSPTSNKKSHDLNVDLNEQSSKPQQEHHHHHHHHHYHYDQPSPAREATKSNPLDNAIHEKPFVQININGSELDKHKPNPAGISSFQGLPVVSTAYVVVPTSTIINDASLLDPQRLNQSSESLPANINNAPVVPQISKSATLLSNPMQPLLVAAPPSVQPSPSGYMLVQQADPAPGIQGLLSAPVMVAAQAQPESRQLVSKPEPLLPSISYLEQQLNLQQLQLQQQQYHQQQMMTLMAMMMRPQMNQQSQNVLGQQLAWPQVVPLTAGPRYPMALPPPPPPPQPHHHHNHDPDHMRKREEDDEEDGKSRREKRRERRNQDKRRREKDEPDVKEDELVDENGEPQLKDEKPENKSILSNLVSGFGLPNALRQSPDKKAADKVAREGSSLKNRKN